MKRRSFLKYTSALAAGMAFPFHGFAINPTPQLPFLAALANAGNPNGRVLVLIQLIGGNDGLNTFVPLDQYDKLANSRSNIVIPPSEILALSGNPLNGMHPSMTEMREMYDDGLVSVVQNVGYPNQDYSHFRSTDIWMTASDSHEFLETGWLGRYLQGEHPVFPEGYPNVDFPDPLAIQIGSVVSLTFMGATVPIGMAIADPTAFYQFVNDIVDPVPNSPYGDELEYVRLVAQQAEIYYASIKGAAEVGTNLSTKYPADGENRLADQLKIVAQLISGGLETPVYLVSIDGFDTHSDQVEEAGMPSKGIHADLLKKVSEAIGAFQDDLKLLGVADRVAGMTFSEFGRTIASNSSLGTDHGAAAPLFVFGEKVIPGVIGKNPVLPFNPSLSDDIPMEYDFRSVYASALQDWFGLANPESVLGEPYPILPIFEAATSTHTIQKPATISINCYPNPFMQQATVAFAISGGRTFVRLLDTNGRVLRTLAEGMYPQGEYTATLNRGNLPSGIYLIQVQVNGSTLVRQVMIG